MPKIFTKMDALVLQCAFIQKTFGDISHSPIQNIVFPYIRFNAIIKIFTQVDQSL